MLSLEDWFTADVARQIATQTVVFDSYLDMSGSLWY